MDSCLVLLAVVLSGHSQAQTWQERFVNWHKANEFRAYGGSANSADLAWWESYLLQSYLGMYAATRDTFWLGRLCAHADTMIAVMRDAPDSGDFWPGYRDGFLGWGTTRYDPDHRYQEYMVHDGQTCLPLARFCRLVRTSPELGDRFGPKAERYLSVIETQVVAKWFENWAVRRGDAEHLAGFGGWTRLPHNQFLVFGELLLVLSDIPGSTGLIPGSFYSDVPDSMARVLRTGLIRDSGHDCWVWSHWPYAVPTQRYEDISHANLDISFALAAHAHGMMFGDSDLALLARTLTSLMWDGSETDPRFSRFVNGTGGYDDYTGLEDWLRLNEHDPDVYRLVSQAYLVHPEWTEPSSTSSCRALVLANLAELDSRNAGPARTDVSAGNRPSASDIAGSFGIRNSTFVISPNPFRTRTAVSLPLTAHGSELRIHDATGRCVRSLAVSCQPSAVGSFVWDGTDDSGRRVAPGTYLCMLTGPGMRLAQKLTLISAP